MEKVRAFPLASVSGGSTSDTFIDCPGSNLKSAGLAKRNAIVPSATVSLATSVVSYLGIERSPRSGRALRPGDFVIVEAAGDRGFHHLEIGRDVEVARRVKAVMADVHDFAVAVDASGVSGLLHDNVRQDRITHRLERLGYQRRADRARRVAAAERDHAAAPAHRDWRRRNQIAREIEHVLQVVAAAYARDGEPDHGLQVLLRQSDRPADAGMHSIYGRKRHGPHSVDHVGLYEDLGLFPGFRRAERVADVQRGVRPGRLSQVFDGDAYPRVPLDEQDVPRPQRRAEQIERGCRDLGAARGLCKVFGEAPTRPTQYGVHGK